MKSWLLINMILSASVLLTVVLLRDAPARLRMWLCIAAMLAWCFPLRPILLTDPSPVLLQWDVVSIAPLQSIPPAVSLMPPTWTWGWWKLLVATGAGLCWFGLDWFRARRLQQQWSKHSTSADQLIARSPTRLRQTVAIRLLPNSREAVTTGVLNPTIWLGDGLVEAPELPMVLCHELTHVQRRDNLWLSVITLIQRVFWWNPLVLILATRSRALLELSCDERCSALHGGKRYRDSLAGLLAQRQPKLASPIGLSFFSKPSLSIQRLKHLGREIKMKKRHFAVLVGLIAVCMITMVEADDFRSVRSSTSISIDDDGSLRWVFVNASLGSAAQSLAKLGGLTVIGHPDIDQLRVSERGQGSISNWRGAIDTLLRTHAGRVGYQIEGDTLLLMPAEVTETGDRSWLSRAMRYELPAAPPPPSPPAIPSAPPAPASPGNPENVVPPKAPDAMAEPGDGRQLIGGQLSAQPSPENRLTDSLWGGSGLPWQPESTDVVTGVLAAGEQC